MPPLTIGVTVPDPTAGPTEAGVSVQVSVPVNAPVTAQAEGDCVDPLNGLLRLPAVAVTGAGLTVKFAVPLLPA